VTVAQQKLDLAKLNNLPTVSGQASLYVHTTKNCIGRFHLVRIGEVEDFHLPLYMIMALQSMEVYIA